MRDIDPILQLLASSRARFLATLDTVPEDRWRQSSRPGVWSAAELAAHVTMVERSVNKNAVRILGVAPASVPLLKRIHLPVRISSYRLFKVKSPFQMKQELLEDKPKHIEMLAASRKLTVDFLEANRQRDLAAYRAPHPLLGSINLYDWYKFIAYHEERHRKQLRDVVESFRI